MLDIGGELTRFFDLILQRDFLHQILQFVNCIIRNCILACRHFQCLRRRSEIQVIGLHSARIRIAAGIGVNRDEQVRLLLVGDSSAAFQGNKGVVPARINYVRAHASLQEIT